MTALDYARRLKHRGLVARKRARTGYVRARDSAFRLYDRHVPYQFDIDRHRDSWGNLPRMYFLDREPPPGTETDRTVPDVIYSFWTGDNQMGPARQQGIESIVAHNPDLAHVLVTPDNLTEFVLPQHPLHPAYAHLSLVHRADYLRAYFMHHYGGGYSDIKQTDHGWRHAWQTLSDSPELWAIGYPEVSSASCGGRDLKLGPDVRRRFNSLIGYAAFVFRPNSPFTAEWLREVERRLDFYSQQLVLAPGNTWGDNPGYPIGWIELGSDLFHPLQLKYLTHIGQDPALLPHLDDHR
ncbi:glycosyltransferase [Nocardioides sp.]|uniref:glycosyltransferase n=1 Tax=Nocardioides sp. TaxID=35761 RepID=UPI0026016C05|nr:glycosyltransferase [Nocardioides sp.]